MGDERCSDGRWAGAGHLAQGCLRDTQSVRTWAQHGPLLGEQGLG